MSAVERAAAARDLTRAAGRYAERWTRADVLTAVLLLEAAGAQLDQADSDLETDKGETIMSMLDKSAADAAARSFLNWACEAAGAVAALPEYCACCTCIKRYCQCTTCSCGCGKPVKR